jgi:sec-independent protein translocase protein TatB
MFDIAYSELLMVAVVALVVIGPKDLPRALRTLGAWVRRARSMAGHVRAGFDEMMRQAELEEMEREWRAQNARIMAAHPAPPLAEALPPVPPAASAEGAEPAVAAPPPSGSTPAS